MKAIVIDQTLINCAEMACAEIRAAKKSIGDYYVIVTMKNNKTIFLTFETEFTAEQALLTLLHTFNNA
jgi:predicted nucleic acid-binding protein